MSFIRFNLSMLYAVLPLCYSSLIFFFFEKVSFLFHNNNNDDNNGESLKNLFIFFIFISLLDWIEKIFHTSPLIPFRASLMMFKSRKINRIVKLYFILLSTSMFQIIVKTFTVAHSKDFFYFIPLMLNPIDFPFIRSRNAVNKFVIYCKLIELKKKITFVT